MGKILDTIHVKIHALRLLQNYVPTQFEYEMNKLIAETFADSCEECRQTAEKLKYLPFQQKKSFLGGIFK